MAAALSFISLPGAPTAPPLLGSRPAGSSATGSRATGAAGAAALALPLFFVGALWARGSRRRQAAEAANARCRVVRCAEAEAKTEAKQDAKEARKKTIPSRAMGATLRARIWDMLGLSHKAGKEEIRKAYKEFVRLSHPDLNNGKQPEGYNERFQRLTTEYNAVMKLDDNAFWLEQFDCGATRLATKRVDGPSLNPWERRFRTWARANDLLEVDDLEDGDLDCRKRAKLYLNCEDDPTAPGCEVPQEMSVQWRDEPKAAPSEPTPAPKNSGGIRIEQVVAVFAFTVGSFIIAAFGAIVASVVQG